MGIFVVDWVEGIFPSCVYASCGGVLEGRGIGVVGPAYLYGREGLGLGVVYGD